MLGYSEGFPHEAARGVALNAKVFIQNDPKFLILTSTPLPAVFEALTFTP